jgi:hypothetical protein
MLASNLQLMSELPVLPVSTGWRNHTPTLFGATSSESKSLSVRLKQAGQNALSGLSMRHVGRECKELWQAISLACQRYGRNSVFNVIAPDSQFA